MDPFGDIFSFLQDETRSSREEANSMETVKENASRKILRKNLNKFVETEDQSQISLKNQKNLFKCLLCAEKLDHKEHLYSKKLSEQNNRSFK